MPVCKTYILRSSYITNINFWLQKVHFLWLSTFIFFTTCITSVILSIIYPDVKPPHSGTTFSTCYEQQTGISDDIDGEVDLFNSNTSSNISTNISKSIRGSHNVPTPVLNPVLPEISQEKDDLGLKSYFQIIFKTDKATSIQRYQNDLFDGTV